METLLLMSRIPMPKGQVLQGIRRLLHISPCYYPTTSLSRHQLAGRFPRHVHCYHQSCSMSSSSTTTPTHPPSAPSLLQRTPIQSKPKHGSMATKIRQWLNWDKKPPKASLYKSGCLWYCKIADEIDFKAFFKVCKLPDTFASWFAVLELHLWLLSTRLMEEPETGKVVRNAVMQSMWEDIDVRGRKLEGALASARKQQVQELNEQFQAALLGYDEGLLSGNDTVLAGALWRKFLHAGSNATDEPLETRRNATRLLLDDVIALELLVSYIHSEHYRLQQLSRENILFHREFQWSPFDRRLEEIQKFHKR